MKAWRFRGNLYFEEPKLPCENCKTETTISKIKICPCCDKYLCPKCRLI